MPNKRNTPCFQGFGDFLKAGSIYFSNKLSGCWGVRKLDFYLPKKFSTALQHLHVDFLGEYVTARLKSNIHLLR